VARGERAGRGLPLILPQGRQRLQGQGPPEGRSRQQCHGVSGSVIVSRMRWACRLPVSVDGARRRGRERLLARKGGRGEIAW